MQRQNLKLDRNTAAKHTHVPARCKLDQHKPDLLKLALLKLAILTLALLCTPLISSCSFIEFENGPYAVHEFDIVYSQQENMTFLAWRLPRASSPDDYDFELFHEKEQRFLRLDLTQAPYPAKPYTCKKDFVCFQYQIPGRYTFSTHPNALPNPMRTVHHDYGVFPGGPPRVHEVAHTFGIRPIAIDANSAFDPRREDWFASKKIPFKRKYQWQLVDFDDTSANTSPDPKRCATPRSDAWAPLTSKNLLPVDWIDNANCIVARPIAHGRTGTSVHVPFFPSAELVWEVQQYQPIETHHRTFFAFLFDLQITNAQRCEAVKKTIVSTIKEATNKALEDRLATATFIGTYTPISPDTGEPGSGCTQRTRQDYPVAEIIDDLKRAAYDFAPERVRVVFVYLNNMNLPPGGRGLEQIFELDQYFHEAPQLVPYYWAISTNVWLESINWDATTGWAPIEAKHFTDTLKNFPKPRIPFITMEHDFDTPVPIYKPAGAQNPQFFKICDTTPRISGVIYPRDLFPRELTTFAWPEDDDVSYLVDLDIQQLVEYNDYQRKKARIIVETCQRFCNGPFRTQAGIDFDNWRQVPSKCQWSK